MTHPPATGDNKTKVHGSLKTVCLVMTLSPIAHAHFSMAFVDSGCNKTISSNTSLTRLWLGQTNKRFSGSNFSIAPNASILIWIDCCIYPQAYAC